LKSETKGNDDNDDDDDVNRVSLNSDDDSHDSDLASDTSNNIQKVTDFISATKVDDGDDHYYLDDYNEKSTTSYDASAANTLASGRRSTKTFSGAIANTKSTGSKITIKDNTSDISDSSDSSGSSSADSYDDRYDIDNGSNMRAMLGIDIDSPRNEIRPPSHHHQ